MAQIAIRTLVAALALIAAVRLVPDAAFEGEWWQFAAVAAIFGVINAYLRPMIRTLSLPLTVLTFGLFGFVLNGALLLLLGLISGELDLGFTLAGWPDRPLDADVLLTAVATAMVVSLVSTLLAVVRFVLPRV